MSREFESEKEFLKNLDRLLAGEEIKTDPMMEKDLSTSLDFAKKMIALRTSPSSEFKAQLKSRLLKKLVEQEEAVHTEKKHSWFSRFAPRQLVWQAITVVLVMVMVSGIMWSTGVFRFSRTPITNPTTTATVSPTTTSTTKHTTIPTTQPTSPVGQRALLKADASTNKTSYLPGEKVEIVVSLKNVTPQPIKIEKYPPILSLMQATSMQPVYTFAAGIASITLAPDETKKFVVSWDQRDSKGRDVISGEYYLELEDLDYQGQTIQLNFNNPVRFNILPGTTDNGTVEKTIMFNESQNDNGITVNLQRIELSTNGVKLYAFITPPPGYAILGNTPDKDYSASANYYLDGGWGKNAGMSSVVYFSNGMNHVWSISEPVSEENNELIFIVTNVGNYAGYWEFRIPLK